MALTFDQSGKSITKFNVPGMNPDMRFKISENDEIHVHSALLKIHSPFFRAFLDSPEKIVPASTESTYEWVSEIDGDGEWHLVAAQSASGQIAQPNPNFALSGEVIKAFRNLIRAIHHEPYSLRHYQQLDLLTKLADYYQCLQIVSKSLTQVLQSSFFWEHMRRNGSVGMVNIAIKLRHLDLFRDSLIMLQNPLPKTRIPVFLENDAAYHISSSLRENYFARIGKVTSDILAVLTQTKHTSPRIHQEMCDFMQRAAAESSSMNPDGTWTTFEPKYYYLLENFTASDGSHPFALAIHNSELRDNELTILRGEYFCWRIREGTLQRLLLVRCIIR